MLLFGGVVYFLFKSHGCGNDHFWRLESFARAPFSSIILGSVYLTDDWRSKKMLGS